MLLAMILFFPKFYHIYFAKIDQQRLVRPNASAERQPSDEQKPALAQVQPLISPQAEPAKTRSQEREQGVQIDAMRVPLVPNPAFSSGSDSQKAPAGTAPASGSRLQLSYAPPSQGQQSLFADVGSLNNTLAALGDSYLGEAVSMSAVRFRESCSDLMCLGVDSARSAANCRLSIRHGNRHLLAIDSYVDVGVAAAGPGSASLRD